MGFDPGEIVKDKSYGAGPSTRCDCSGKAGQRTQRMSILDFGLGILDYSILDFGF